MADSQQADAEQTQKLLSDKSAEHDILTQQLQELEDQLQASAERLALAHGDHEQRSAETSDTRALTADSIER